MGENVGKEDDELEFIKTIMLAKILGLYCVRVCSFFASLTFLGLRPVSFRNFFASRDEV